MKLGKIKYLFVLTCLFCIMQKTGISALSVFSHIKITDVELAAEKQTDDSENKEAKQVELKEYWAVPSDSLLVPLLLHSDRLMFASYAESQHLSWYPPVSTPPPDIIA